MAETIRSDQLQQSSVSELSERLDGLGRWLDAHELTYGIAGGVAQSLQAMGTFLRGGSVRTGGSCSTRHCKGRGR